MCLFAEQISLQKNINWLNLNQQNLAQFLTRTKEEESDLDIYDQSQHIFEIFSLTVPIARFKPSISGLWIEYSTTVAQVHNLMTKVLNVHDWNTRVWGYFKIYYYFDSLFTFIKISK